MPESSIIEINLSAVSHNLAVMRDMVGEGCMLCPVVKADAYGLGAVRIAKRMASSGAEMLAVFSPEQAAALAVAAIDVPVLVLMPVRDFSRGDDLYRMLVSGLLHLTVHDLRHLEELRRLAEKFAAVVPVHLEVDTGMSRGGCLPEEAGEVLRRVATCRSLRLAGVFTHFSNPRGRAEDAAPRWRRSTAFWSGMRPSFRRTASSTWRPATRPSGTAASTAAWCGSAWRGPGTRWTGSRAARCSGRASSCDRSSPGGARSPR